MATVELTEVVLRDGLQDEPVKVSVQDRLRIAAALVEAGFRSVEAGSFVNPARVPQMAGAEELFPALPEHDGVVYSALALNARGVDRAVEAGVGDITLVASASLGHSRANAGRDPERALEETAAAVRAHPSVRFSAGVAVAFTCPFDGPVPPERLRSVVEGFVRMGLTRIGLADTLGTTEPERVVRMLGSLREAFPETDFGLHLHNAHGQALRTVDLAVGMGVSRFDTAAGGYGGCPFAPGAHGNVASELMVRHLHERGVDTGVDEEALADAVALVRDRIAHSRPV